MRGGDGAREAELLKRWKTIEEEEDDDRYRRLKESWFADAFEFLKKLPADRHCWCHHRDVSMPLLETFHAYFKSADENLSIKVLWKRLSSELSVCTSCVVQYYQVKEHYRNEYMDAVVKPILAVLLTLDKQRVISSMQSSVKTGDERSVACLLYELFMYPELLDDSDLNEGLVQFMRYVSDTHELQFATDRKYPGLCALLFHSSQVVRGVAYNLATTLEPFKNAEELEVVQPLLEKRMKFLESPSPVNAIVGVTFESLWQGLKSILHRLEAPAIEDGIMESYPLFLGVVLNYVSESGSTVFWNALCCLKTLLKVLGLKLWLKSSFTPSVLRNTLLSQCFHVKDEKIHKEVFDIFEFFLQSLEALQDGQYERQRRYLLYFLLQQVPFSSNFSPLTKKLGSKVAFDIVARSYKMEPPLPPFDCAHFWGPSLLASIKDTELPLQYRQSALNLTGILLVADAAALSALYCKVRPSKEEDAGAEGFSWQSFIQQVESESDNWYCVPLIWIGALETTAPSVFSSSLLKAFLWAASRLSIFEVNVAATTGSAAFSASLHWQIPTGCDDGSDGKGCLNAMKASSNFRMLINVFKRCTDSFGHKFRADGIFVDWQWEPTMAECFILLLMNSSVDLRMVAKDILQQFSKDNGLDSVIHFFCKSEEALDYIIRGFSHAVKFLSVEPYGHCSSRQHVYFLGTRFLSFGSQVFSRKLSTLLWPSLVNAIIHGQQCLPVTGYEASCSRLFDLLPLVFKYTIPSAELKLWNVSSNMDSPSWFRSLLAWSSTPFPSIRRRYIEALVSILEDLARGGVSQSKEIKELLQPGSVLENEERERLLLLFSSNAHELESLKSDTKAGAEVVLLSSDEEAKPVVSKKGPDVQAEPGPSGRQHKRPAVRKVASQTLHRREDLNKQKQYEPRQSHGEMDIRNLLGKNLNKLASQPQQLTTMEPPTKPVEMEKQAKPIQQVHQVSPAERKQQRPIEPVLPAEAKNADDMSKLLNDLVSEDEVSKKQRAPLMSTAPKERRKLMKIDMPVPDAQLKPSILPRNKRRPGKPPPPKMDEWLMRILSLDLFADNEDPPDLVKVPLSFRNVEQYMEVFRPLLIEEFRAQLHRARDEFNADDTEKVGMVHLMSLERVDNLHVARFKSEAGKVGASSACTENDLLLISKKPFLECPGSVHLLGKVDRRDKDVFSAKLFLPPNNEKLFKLKSVLHIRSTWHITRLMNITPQVREFQAVSALSSSPLLEAILSPAASDQHSGRPVPLPEKLWRKLKEDYNESQLSAIKASLGDSRKDQHEISLVQGPPGTGKTRTIVAIVSALLHSRESNEDVCRTSGNQRLSHHAAVASSWQAMAYAKQIERDQLAPTKAKARVLVCAQSNAAVDELVGRLREIYSPTGQLYRPKLVRTGNARLVHPDSVPVFIDTLIKEDADTSQEDSAQELVSKLEQVTEKINEILRRKSEGVHDDSLMAKLTQLEQQKNDLNLDIRKSRKTFEISKERRRKLKNQNIRDADIVLTTLGGCGGDVYAACMDTSEKDTELFFDAVVIDEAGQALEPASLIPLQFLGGNHGRCVLVGDPKQLPATVLSQAASSVCYERSMFERFQKNGYPVTMLSTQYRMHPDIRKFPSSYFYNNQLVDGASVLGDKRRASFHNDRFFRPYTFFDVIDGQERAGGSSVGNVDEVDVAVKLYERFQAKYPQEIQPGRIGVITPYKQQLNMLKRAFQRFGEKISSILEFNTIDGFQGREVDILILSTVRASLEPKGIGFVADIRRMNVALTRPRFSLWIIGSAMALRSNRAWAALLEDATSRGAVYPIQKPYSKAFNCRGDQNITRDVDPMVQGGGGTSSRKRPGEQTGSFRDKKKQKRGEEVAKPPRGIKILDEAPDTCKQELHKKARASASLDNREHGSSSRRVSANQSEGGAKVLQDNRQRDGRRAVDSTVLETRPESCEQNRDRQSVEDQRQNKVEDKRPPVPSSKQQQSGPARKHIDANETKRKGREEVLALLSGSLFDSKRPGSLRFLWLLVLFPLRSIADSKLADLSSRQASRSVAPPKRPSDLPKKPREKN
ncbi:uncharacterized protein LOC9647084 isoform X1 [Selaginella moellendorffii]|uniref:uncharacterized protein LOC9647084 isoform X1 n=1 Tax=Selaginella moellendorffii TaxID=88036 RepID=UPI000D1C5BFD|nr:uncharacterized protein LOC9647084 isoform X1 [Selaginella moellendorffii]|eukprot:XP_024540869.1 uncharacterized protein LOC9647084 isoform X1 [Selaginella moellendorffii]